MSNGGRTARANNGFTHDVLGGSARQDSNLGMAESKSNWFALTIKARSEESRKFDLNPFKRLANISECPDAFPVMVRCPPEAEVTIESCRARHKINSLAKLLTLSVGRSYHIATKHFHFSRSFIRHVRTNVSNSFRLSRPLANLMLESNGESDSALANGGCRHRLLALQARPLDGVDIVDAAAIPL